MIPNLKPNRLASAAIIIVAALVIPMWFAQYLGLGELPLTAASVSVGCLYVLVVVGFIFFVVGKRGPAVSSEAMDAKISATYAKVVRKLRPIFIILTALWLVWAGFQFWRLYRP
jgi:TRAP-type C4-dicarboxylate transport system permease small subunit